MSETEFAYCQDNHANNKTDNSITTLANETSNSKLKMPNYPPNITK